MALGFWFLRRWIVAEIHSELLEEDEHEDCVRGKANEGWDVTLKKIQIQITDSRQKCFWRTIGKKAVGNGSIDDSREFIENVSPLEMKWTKSDSTLKNPIGPSFAV